MKKRIFSCILALCMIVSLTVLLTACNNDPAPTQGPVRTPGPQGGQNVVPVLPPDAYNGTTNLRIAPNGMTINVFYEHGGNGTISDEQLIFRAAEAITGVRINNVANPNIADGQESLTEMILSGNVANLIFGHVSYLTPMIDEGLFMDIAPLIYQYAPNIVRYFNTVNAAQVASTWHDGGIYNLRAALVGADALTEQPSVMFFIRHDWLAQLNLPIPTTLEQYRDTLYAFKAAEIAGPDTIPYFGRLGEVRPLMQLWGVQGDWAGWFIDDNGKVGHGQVSLEYRTALAELRQWYVDGIIDPLIFTRGGNARAELLSQNNGGSTIDWPGSTGALNFADNIRAGAPEMDWGVFRQPANINGELRAEWGRGSVSAFAWGVAAGTDYETALAIVRFMDFWFTDEGALLVTYGVEGESFHMVNGQPEWLPHAREHEGGLPMFMRTLGIQEFPKWPGDIMFEVGGFAQRTQDGYFDALAHVQTISPFPPLAYLPHEQALINAVDWTALEEFRQQVILGVRDVHADWDAYIEEARRSGVFAAMEAKQTAYDRFLAAPR
jgi:putative aldouronate transport system substrate-binding protein